MSFDTDGFLRQLDDNVIVALSDIDIRLTETAHPFETENGAAIAANWERETASNPALFNGRVVLPMRARLEGDVLTGESRPVQFATLLYWARQADNPGGIHLFAFAVPISRDNAIMAILKPVFGVTDDQIDEAWTQAAGF